ncbi:MAG: nucleoside deaminase [Spirochaetes bacterium]|nr:nucleoside deaminase [Spirochaetota bacterium]
MKTNDVKYMELAIQQAQKGFSEGGIPIGAVLVHNDQVIGQGHNQRVQKGSAILHGEMDCLENTGRQPASVYQDSTMYTTLSPCPMCSGAMVLYGIKRVVIGENKTFMGEEEWLKSHDVEVVVLQDQKCIDMMNDFIEKHPAIWNEDIGI